MAIAAYLPIVADRVGACVRLVRFVGVDLTDVSMRLQIRLQPDTPGAPLVDLVTAAADAEGLALISVNATDGITTSTVQIRIAEATMKDNSRTPYMGELGDPSILAYDWIGTFGGDKRRLTYGEFVALASVNGADNAPASRSAGTSPGRSWPTWSIANVTMGTDSTTVAIEGADLLAPIVAATQASAADAAASAASVAGFVLSGVRPVSSLLVRDVDDVEMSVFDAVGVLSPDRLLPSHADPFLGWLLACPGIRWAGDFNAARGYTYGDLLRHGEGYFLCYDACSSGPAAPSVAPEYFEPIPLFDMTYSVGDDPFSTSPGTLYPTTRPFGRGVRWSVGGNGYTVAQVTAGGYLTAAGNTYFHLFDIPGSIAEFALEFAVINNAAPSSTMAWSPNNFLHFESGSPGGTISMYHINDHDLAGGGVGVTLVWDDGGQSYTPSYRFSWRDATMGIQEGRNYRRQVLARGNILLGVINGRIAYVQVCDQVGALVSAANSVYTQNPEYSDVATETVTVLGDTRFYRATVIAGETL